MKAVRHWDQEEKRGRLDKKIRLVKPRQYSRTGSKGKGNTHLSTTVPHITESHVCDADDEGSRRVASNAFDSYRVVSSSSCGLEKGFPGRERDALRRRWWEKEEKNRVESECEPDIKPHIEKDRQNEQKKDKQQQAREKKQRRKTQGVKGSMS
jgi:hypothetical protein